MSSEKVVIYHLIPSAKDRDFLLNGLVTSATPVRLVSGEVEGLTLIERRESNGDLVLKFLTSSEFPSEAQVTVRFETRGRWYFFKSTPIWFSGGAIVPVPQEVYEEQLRKSFRHIVPSIYPSCFEVTRRETGNGRCAGNVLDLNSDGVGFLASVDDAFVVGEKIEGTLTLGRHRPVSTAAFVRFVRPQADGQLQVGVEFDHGVHGTEDDLNGLIMCLRHDVFYLDPKNSKLSVISNS